MRESALKTREDRLKFLKLGHGWNKGLKGFGSFNKGKKRTKEMKEKYSIAAKKRFKNPENHPCWKGGRKKHGTGYIQIRMPEHPRANKYGYVLEHIVIWEKANNKIATRDISIHHLNGIKDDNQPENLVAMKKGEHINQGIIYQKRIRELEQQIKKWHVKIQEFPKIKNIGIS